MKPYVVPNSFVPAVEPLRGFASDSSFAGCNDSEPDVPDVPDVAVPSVGRVRAPDGEYDIEEVVGCGYIDPRNRPEDHRLAIRYAICLEKDSNVTWDGPIPEGLPENWRDLVDQANPAHTAVKEVKHRCRWCKLSVTSGSNQRRHEKNCKFPVHLGTYAKGIILQNVQELAPMIQFRMVESAIN
jgi:hypothetical protein